MASREGSLAAAMAGGGWLRAALLCAGVWLHAADSLLVATVMPTAIGEIGGLAYISWTVALYVLGSVIAGAATGLLVLRLGLRNAMAASALLYALGCVASALTPDMAGMLVGRLLQGLGGGWMVALAYVGVTRLFPAPLWPQLLALIAGVWGTSALVGPLVGGLFAEAGLWRGGFWAFGGQALLLAVAIPLALRDGLSAPASAVRLPWPALSVLACGVAAILWAGVLAGPLAAAGLALLGLALLAAALAMDHRSRADRLFPPSAFDPRRRWGQGYAMILTLSAASVTFTVYGPLLMEVLYDTRPLAAGLMVALEALAWTITAILFANAGRRWEPWLIRGGAAAVALSVPGMALAMPAGPVWEPFPGTLIPWTLAPWALLAGGGFGTCWAFMLRRIVESLPDSERERAAAAAPTVQILGYAIGAAFCGMVANLCGMDAGTATVAAARSAGFWVFAAFLPVALAGFLAAWRLAGPAPPATRRPAAA